MRQILSCFSLFVANSHVCHIFLSKKTPKKLETDKIHPTFASETTPTTQQVGMKTRNNNKKRYDYGNDKIINFEEIPIQKG